jgi:hypothetical protein
MKKNLPFQFTSLLILTFLVFRSANLLAQSNECPTPTNMQFYDIGLHEVTITWDGPSELFYDITLVANTSSGSDHGYTNGNSVTITDLESNTTYQVRIEADCPMYMTSGSLFGSVTTLPDCEPATNVVFHPTTNSVNITWEAGASSYYYLSLLQKDGTVVDSYEDNVREVSFSNLSPDTEYEFQLTVICDDGSEMRSTHVFKTLALPVLNYCLSEGEDSRKNYISRVILNEINNNSGDDGGYADNTSLSATLQQGEVYTFNVKPGGLPNKKYVSAWIDLNNDGDFYDAGEEILYLPAIQTAEVSTSIVIPTSSYSGSVRLRVIVSQHKNTDPCSLIHQGETEDYTVFIEAPEPNPVSVQPNPVKDNLYVTGGQSAQGMIILNSTGQVMYKGSVVPQLSVSGWKEGLYYMIIEGSERKTLRFVKD